MSKKLCKICGKEGYLFYPYCYQHLPKKNSNANPEENLKNSEKEKIIEEQKNKENKQSNDKCIICGATTTNNYLFCKNCYYNIEERKEELDKNQKPTKLKDYYYNARDYAMRIFDEEKIYYQKLTMTAINSILKQLYQDTSIDDRLVIDIKDINENLKKKMDKLTTKIKEPQKINLIKEEQDKDKAKIKKTQDGHFVESELEIIVDDILYNLNIVHAYNIKVDEITERTVICDWFIPITYGKGIYIELWGMTNNEKYNKNKKEKIELYHKHKLPLIEITNGEVKNDTQRLVSYIKNKHRELKDQILGIERN